MRYDHVYRNAISAFNYEFFWERSGNGIPIPGASHLRGEFVFGCECESIKYVIASGCVMSGAIREEFIFLSHTQRGLRGISFLGTTLLALLN